MHGSGMDQQWVHMGQNGCDFGGVAQRVYAVDLILSIASRYMQLSVDNLIVFRSARHHMECSSSW